MLTEKPWKLLHFVYTNIVATTNTVEQPPLGPINLASHTLCRAEEGASSLRRVWLARPALAPYSEL